MEQEIEKKKKIIFEVIGFESRVAISHNSKQDTCHRREYVNKYP